MKYVYLALVILSAFFVLPLVFRGCVPDIIGKPYEVSAGKDLSPKEIAEVKKIVPDAEITAKNIPIKPAIGKQVVETIVVTADKKIVILTKEINDFGWHKGLGVFGSMGLDTGDFGLSFTGPWYWRLNTDLLIGIKKMGAGLSFQTFKNTSAGLSYNLNYNTLLASPAVYIKMEF